MRGWLEDTEDEIIESEIDEFQDLKDLEGSQFKSVLDASDQIDLVENCIFDGPLHDAYDAVESVRQTRNNLIHGDKSSFDIEDAGMDVEDLDEAMNLYYRTISVDEEISREEKV